MIYDPLLGSNPSASADVSDQPGSLVVDDEAPTLIVQEERPTVVVDEHGVAVVSVGVQGPPGPAFSGEAPIVTDYETLKVRIAPGTVNGQGLIWTGSAWENRQVVPAGANGTVPYKSGTSFTGDDVNLRYEASQQALYVTKIEASVLDGGNF